MKKSDYYSYDKILSHNAVWNFIVGGRGIGKTYGAKAKTVKAFTRARFGTGPQFIYVRRYKPELKAARDTFFNDIVDLFPDWDFRFNGNIVEASPGSMRDDKKREWDVMAYFLPLSVAQSFKSVAFPRVKTIIFDEFIIEKGNLQYLSDEPTVFTNLYNTVDRYKDKTRVYFLANSVSIMNPYFIKFKIRPDQEKRIVLRAIDRNTGLPFVAAEFVDSKDFNNAVYQTRFGKFIEGTDYADYAVGNDFEDNNDNLIELKGMHAKYFFTLECKTGTLSVWYDMRQDQYFVQQKRPGQEQIFTLLPERMSEEKTLMTFSDKPLGNLRTAFRGARVTFDLPESRNIFTEIFKR